MGSHNFDSTMMCNNHMLCHGSAEQSNQNQIMMSAPGVAAAREVLSNNVKALQLPSLKGNKEDKADKDKDKLLQRYRSLPKTMWPLLDELPLHSEPVLLVKESAINTINIINALTLPLSPSNSNIPSGDKSSTSGVLNTFLVGDGDKDGENTVTAALFVDGTARAIPDIETLICLNSTVHVHMVSKKDENLFHDLVFLHLPLPSRKDGKMYTVLEHPERGVHEMKNCNRIVVQRLNRGKIGYLGIMDLNEIPLSTDPVVVQQVREYVRFVGVMLYV